MTHGKKLITTIVPKCEYWFCSPIPELEKSLLLFIFYKFCSFFFLFHF